MRGVPGRARANGALWFAAGLAVATGLTFWFGLRATREWQRSTAQAAERRGNEVVTLLGVALERDMRGGQISVLLKLNQQELTSIAPYELADAFARGFVRFPYLESFFVWTAGDRPDGSTYIFHRADRIPVWDRGELVDDPYPVVFRRNPAALGSVVQQARAEAMRGSRFALFDTSVDNVRYQAVAHLLYDGTGPDARLASLVGFTVNLEWVRAHYFADFIRQVQAIINDPSLSIRIVDSDAGTVAAVGAPAPRAPVHERTFPLVFADQALLSNPPRERAAAWTARVGVADETSIAAASRGATRTLTLLGLGALVTLIGLGFTVRAARTAADLAAVQSEFVSAVSHEMKTPLSLIKLASDTLAKNRYDSPAAIADYGRLMAVESQHLTRLIDNVLCYARISDTTSSYDLEPLDIAEPIQETIDRFRPQLNELGMAVEIHTPPDALVVDADHAMMGHVFDNLVDNAIKYAASGRALRIAVTSSDGTVQVDVADRGEGIPAADLAHVFDKFYRRRGTRQSGAGLGLAIVRRIVEDHKGSVRISSVVGEGTTVALSFPASGE